MEKVKAFIFFIFMIPNLRAANLDTLIVKSMSKISTFGNSTCAIIKNNVKCWGHGGVKSPLKGLNNPAQIAMDYYRVCVLDNKEVICQKGIDDSNAKTLKSVSYISGGYNHFCAVGDGRVECWGKDQNIIQNIPENIDNPIQVVSGISHACVLDDNGVSCWGDNQFGQTDVPLGIKNPRGIFATNHITCAVHSIGLECWGRGITPEFNKILKKFKKPHSLGKYFLKPTNTVCLIENDKKTCLQHTPPSKNYNASTHEFLISHYNSDEVHLSMGEEFLCTLNGDTVNCSDYYSQHSLPYGQLNHFEPIHLVNPRRVEARGYSTCGFGDNDGLSCWGAVGLRGNGLRGDKEKDFHKYRNITDLSLGSVVGCVIANGKTDCWIDDENNHYGIDLTLPFPLKVSAGFWHACVLSKDGVVKCMGPGLHIEKKFNFTAHIPPRNIGKATDLSVGHDHSCVQQKNTLKILCWGDNSKGQLDIPEVLQTSSVIKFDSGADFSCANYFDGDRDRVVCWGDNNKGQLNVPLGLTSITDLDAGEEHACAISSKNGVVCWGRNDYGQLNVPGDLVNPTQVAAGRTHTCAVTDLGIRCWGSNRFGEGDVPNTRSIY